MIFTLQSHQIAQRWNEIEPFLFEHDDWTPADVRAQLESEHAQLWVLQDGDSIRGIVITKLKDQLGVLWIASGKGLDSEAMQMLSAIEAWMTERGVRQVRIEGRRGWGRVLNGYEEKATVFSKRL